jgi:tetratricopeptide (TPR) repeat protein
MMGDADKNDPDSRLALVLFRYFRHLDQGDFARAARIAQSQLSVYERGERAAPREVLERAALVAGFPVHLLDSLLLAIRSFRGAAVGQSRSDRIFANGMAAEFIALLRRVADVVLQPLGQKTSEESPGAEVLWAYLKECEASERRMLVEELEEYWSESLCLRVAAESIRNAPNRPREALELAELALFIAERIPGEEAGRLWLQGYSWAHVSNARRVCNDLPGAEQAILRARKLWDVGVPTDSPGSNGVWLPWIEATLRRAQRRFPEALTRIGEALALDSGELRGQILLSKSAIYQILGDPEGSAAALSEAAPLIDPVQEPRLAFGVSFNLLVDLCHLGRFGEAERLLPQVRTLAERLEEELDLTRVVWLGAKVAGGLGRTDEARAAFEQARQVFNRRKLAYDYALMSLELGLLLLEQARTGEVKALAEEMLPIFRTQKVERESLAALRLFCEAAQQETATAELARRLIRFLYRAQHDPELRFTEDATGA